MRNAETVLSIIRERGRRGLPLERVYRLLFNPSLYLMAYGRIYRNDGAMTPGVTAETADGMSLAKIERIIERLRHERYPLDIRHDASTSRRKTRPRSGRWACPRGRTSWLKKSSGSSWMPITSRSSATTPMASAPNADATPRFRRYVTGGQVRRGSSKVTSPNALTTWTIRSCCQSLAEKHPRQPLPAADR